MTYNISTGRLDSDEETEYLSDRDNSPVHVLRPMNEDEDIHHRDWSYTPPRSRRRGRGLTVHRPERSLSHDRSRKFYTDSRDPEGSIYPTSVERPSRSVHWKHPAPASSETKDLAPETGEKSDSSIKSQKNTFDTVLCSADEAKDITVHLDLGASLDLSDELSHLSRLNRLGHFKAGISFFESRLAQHMDFFPVVAEYADLLQQQGAFGNMSRFVHTRCHDSSVSYSHNEMTLLKLLECVANIHTKGALLPALEMAKSVLGQSEELDDGSNQENLSRYRSHSLPKTTSQHLSEDVQMKKSTEKSKFGPEGSFRIQKCSWFHSSIGMRIQIIELSLEIISLAHSLSSYLETEQFRPLLNWGVTEDELVSLTRDHKSPLEMKGSRHRTAGQNYYPSIKARASNLPPASDSDESVSEASWRAGSDTAFPRLGPWYDFLVKEGYHWESHRLLSFILTLICDEYGSYPQDGSFELAFGLEKLQDAVDKFCERKPNKGKDEQILLTNFANATMLIAFLNVPSNDKVLAVQDQFRKIAKSIAGKIFTDHWELINSRIYFGWLLAESNPRSFLFDEPQFRRTPPSTSDLCRKNANEQSSADKTKKQPETRSVPDTLESKLRLIERNAAALGDLCTRYDAFVRLANMSEDDQRAVYTAKDLSLLCHEEMNDTIGYAFCLESETRMLQKSSNNIPNLTDRRQDLYLRFKKFEEMFPCHFDYTPFDKRRHYRNITFFDVPAACDEKKRGLSRLLLAMDLPVGAQFALSNMDSIGEHLPKKNPIKGHFGRYRCSGCEYCDNTNHDVYHLSRPSHYSAAPLTTGTSTNTRNRQWGEAGPYYQRPPRAPRAYSEPGNMNNSGERLPLHRQPEISSDVWDIDEMLPEKLRMKDQKSARKPETAKDTTTANERSSASPDTPRVRRASPVTSAEPSRMLDENDRAFLVPHAACESFTELKSQIRAKFRDNHIVRPDMEEGSYEIMDMDGTPVTEQNWRTLVSAGSTLRIRLLDTGLGDEKDQQENDLSRAQDQPPQNAEDVSLAESIDVFEADSGPENQDYDESAGNPSRDA